MTETLHEFCDWRGGTTRVDRAAGVIRGVKILGTESRNGRSYLPEALAQAARLYEEAKVNVNHAKNNPAGPRDYQDRIGVIRNVAARRGEGLFADFHFNPKHALAEQLLWDAEHAAENVGFSHNVEARTGRRGERVVVEAITRVVSVDLVADPATTRGLFESAETGTGAARSALTLDDLRRDYPHLVEQIGREHSAEVRRLEAEVQRLSGAAAASEKQQAVRRLLREFQLPDPDSSDPAARSVTSPALMESLLAAPSEQAMRALVEERAKLVRALRAGGGGKPIARDQYLVDGPGRLDTKAFVEAIT